jgi:hypothetical protein
MVKKKISPIRWSKNKVGLDGWGSEAAGGQLDWWAGVAPSQVCSIASQAGGATGRVGQGRRACGSAELVGQGVLP